MTAKAKVGTKSGLLVAISACLGCFLSVSCNPQAGKLEAENETLAKQNESLALENARLKLELVGVRNSLEQAKFSLEQCQKGPAPEEQEAAADSKGEGDSVDDMVEEKPASGTSNVIEPQLPPPVP